MKGLFWNSIGLRDLAKYNFLFDTSCEYHLDFVAILETCRDDFTTSDLTHFCGGKDFFWHWTSPRGQSGGILLEINLQLFDIGNITLGDYHIKFNVKTKVDGFKWALIAAYGAAQDEFKEAFLTEMVQICSTDDKPALIGGDFNIIRSHAEKNNDRYNDRCPFLFNTCI
jgi:exonuclease III